MRRRRCVRARTFRIRALTNRKHIQSRTRSARNVPTSYSRPRSRQCLPAVFEAFVENAVMQTACAALPEFKSIRRHAIAAPERWTWNSTVSEPLADGREIAFQFAAALEHAALVRSPRAGLAFARPRGK